MGERQRLERASVGNRLPVCLAVFALMLISVGRGVAAPAVKPLPPVMQRDAVFEPSVPPPIVLDGITLGESESGGIEVDLSGSGALVWTSYRNGDGDLVVELPNSTPSATLEDLTPATGLVARVRIESRQDGSRPLTRITFTTRREVQHSLAADGNKLHLRLVPTGRAAEGELAYEPIPVPGSALESAAVEPAEMPLARNIESPPVASRDWGTAENPRRSPPPQGVPASRLSEIEVLADGAVRIHGDGEFLYSTFRLSEPERFVVDLSGVVNTSPIGVQVVGGQVTRVRVAQFRPFPEPVSRVVFDLSGAIEPRIERSSDGLLVSFAEAPTQLASMPEPAASAITESATAEPSTIRPMKETAPSSVSEPIPPAAAAETQMAEVDSDPMRSIVPAREEIADTSAMDTPEPVEVEMPATAEVMAPVEPEPQMAAAMPPPPVVTIEAQGEPDEIDEVVDIEPEPVPVPAAPVEQPERIEIVSRAAREAEEAAAFANLEPTPMTSDVELFEAADVTEEPPSRASEFATRSFETQSLTGAPKKYYGEPISLSMRDADLVETLRSFSTISQLSIVVQPQVRGSVTVELRSVPWDQALEQILRINGLGYELEGTIMRIAPIGMLEAEAQAQQALAEAKSLAVPLQTMLRRLSYATAANIANLLQAQGGLLSRRGSVIVDRRTNTLIIQELPQYISTVIAVIDELDTPEPQVMIEARIIETTKRFTRSLGVNWSFDGESSARLGNTSGLQFPNNGTTRGGVNLVTGAANAFFNLSLGNVLNSFNLDIALQAAETEGLIKILSAPRVATLNNQSAEIQSGLQIPIQTIANNTVTVQFINATLSLEVIPHVTAEGTVLMDINIRKREPQLAFAVAGAQNAPIATKEARTRVIVRDGGTAVIGGIYEVTSDLGEDRVPGLANIPIIGHLFRNKRRSHENEELLIFITPRVVNL